MSSQPEKGYDSILGLPISAKLQVLVNILGVKDESSSPVQWSSPVNNIIIIHSGNSTWLWWMGVTNENNDPYSVHGPYVKSFELKNRWLLKFYCLQVLNS